MKKKIIFPFAALVCAVAACTLLDTRSLAARNADALVSPAAAGKSRCFNEIQVTTDFQCFVCGKCDWVDGKGTSEGGWCKSGGTLVPII